MTPSTAVTRYCGARTRTGKSCGRPAGWGTQHVGYGHCKLHGGSTPSQVRRAARERVLAELPFMGGSVDIEPQDALLDCVRRTAGRVMWLRFKLEALDSEGRSVQEDDEAAVIGKMEAASTKDLAQFSKMALDAGVAERKVRIAERQGQVLASAFDATVREHPKLAGLSASDRADLVRMFASQLARVESGEGLPDVEGEAVEA